MFSLLIKRDIYIILEVAVACHMRFLLTIFLFSPISSVTPMLETQVRATMEVDYGRCVECLKKEYKHLKCTFVDVY